MRQLPTPLLVHATTARYGNDCLSCSALTLPSFASQSIVKMVHSSRPSWQRRFSLNVAVTMRGSVSS